MHLALFTKTGLATRALSISRCAEAFQRLVFRSMHAGDWSLTQAFFFPNAKNMNTRIDSDPARFKMTRAFLIVLATVSLPFTLPAAQRDAPDVTIQSFPVGHQPIGVVYDGANIWVANSGDNTVTKLRASDGMLLGTFSVGDTPQEMAFDGANIWVANFFSDNITKLRASDGVVLGTFNGGARPDGMAFDGANIWVANYGQSTVSKLRASDGTLLGTFDIGGTYPQLVAIGAGKAWVTIVLENTVTALRLSDGSLVDAYPVGGSPLGVAFDGRQIWVANHDSGSLTVLLAADGSLVDTIPAVPNPNHIIHAGANMFVTKALEPDGHGAVQTVVARRLVDKGDFSSGGTTPQGLAWDGASVWVANYYSDNVSKITRAAP